MAQQWERERAVRAALDLERNDMLATCLTACVAPHGAWIHVQGDGVVAWVDTDGGITIQRFDWANNKPAYPVYREDNYAGYVKDQGGDPEAHLLTQTNVFGRAGSFTTHVEPIAMRDGIKGITIAFDASTLATLRFIGVFTDGVTQVAGVDWREAVAEMFAFKWTGGTFVQARVERFSLGTRKQGGGPVDDLGAAVIEIQHES